MRRIITIARDFGAGGSTLGRRLAQELGIEYYDRDIILQTAKASAHLSPAQVRQWDERVPHEFGFTQSLFNFYSRPLSEELSRPSANWPSTKAASLWGATRTISCANLTTRCAFLCTRTNISASATCRS